MQQEVIDKEGFLKKRGVRMHQWSTRYFVLSGPKFSYKLKQESTTYRGSFDLVPGCVVTEVLEESRGTIKGKKIYTFWVVWPHDKNNAKEENDSDGDNEDEKTVTAEKTDKSTSKVKDLQKIVESEVLCQKRQKDLAEEQIDRHHAHDSNSSLGMKVAAVAVGGVVVGALTAGIGLVPYLTVVGITAAASGGAVAMQWHRRPADSRIIIACDRMEEAVDWKIALEKQINRLEGSLKPMLPASVDPKVISSILDKSILFSGSWKRVAIYEGMRIMEHVSPGSNRLNIHPWVNDNECLRDQTLTNGSSGTEPVLTSRCCKAQMAVNASPISVFLAMMNLKNWPQNGSIKVVKEIDDHADIIYVEIKNDCSVRGGCKQVTRKMCFSRFWKLEDDGVYLITLNSHLSEEHPASITEGGKKARNASKDPISVDAVITIAPRIDVANFEYDVHEAMVTCVCQVSLDGDWQRGEQTAFMEAFLKDNLLELKQSLLNARFGNHIPPSERVTLGHHHGGSGKHDEYGLPIETMVSNRSSNRQHRAGITTVQPGLDDATSDSYNYAAISNSHMYTGGDPADSDHVIAGHGISVHTTGAQSEKVGKAPSMAGSPPQEKKKKSLFSRVAGTSKNKDKERDSKHPEANSNSNLTAIEKGRPISPLRRVPLTRTTSNNIAPTSSNDEYDSHGSSTTGTTRHNSPPHRNSPPQMSPVSVSGKHIGSPNATSAEFYASPPKPLPVEKKKRDKKTNSEATQMRNQMLATEYELQRLSKTIKKKTVVAVPPAGSSTGKESSYRESHKDRDSVKVDKHHISQMEYNVLQSQLNEQQLKLQQLRNRYTTLTGEPYVPQKSTISRILGRSNAAPVGLPVAQNTSTGSGIAYATATNAEVSNKGTLVQEGTNFVFHTDGVNLKTPSSTKSAPGLSASTSSTPGATNKGGAPRPNHWATSTRTPGMLWEGEEQPSKSLWAALLTDTKGDAKQYRTANVLVVFLLIAVGMATGGIASLLQ